MALGFLSTFWKFPVSLTLGCGLDEERLGQTLESISIDLEKIYYSLGDWKGVAFTDKRAVEDRLREKTTAHCNHDFGCLAATRIYGISGQISFVDLVRLNGKKEITDIDVLVSNRILFPGSCRTKSGWMN